MHTYHLIGVVDELYALIEVIGGGDDILEYLELLAIILAVVDDCDILHFHGG